MLLLLRYAAAVDADYALFTPEAAPLCYAALLLLLAAATYAAICHVFAMILRPC